MDRLLASPVRRGAMIIGTLAYQAITTVIQTLIVFAIAYAGRGALRRRLGRRRGHDCSRRVLISMIIASFSNAIALLVRQHEALIGISQFIVLPLAVPVRGDDGHQARRPPGCSTWRGTTPSTGRSSRSRQALSGDPQWGAVLPRLGWLVAARRWCWAGSPPAPSAATSARSDWPIGMFAASGRRTCHRSARRRWRSGRAAPSGRPSARPTA